MRPGVAEVAFTDWDASVAEALGAVGVGEELARLGAGDRVLLKPNLVNASPPPVTTPAAFTAAVARWVRRRTDATITIAEGAGDAVRETPELFAVHGYDALARDMGLELLDLNHAPTVIHRAEGCSVWPEMTLPAVLFDSFVVSLPVLKAHSLAVVTGAVKNMLGCAPPAEYGGGKGAWKKAAFHARMQAATADLYRHRAPDLAVVDASVGLRDHHLGGPECDPPLGRILAGRDAREVDRAGAALLGLDWKGIGHLRD